MAWLRDHQLTKIFSIWTKVNTYANSDSINPTQTPSWHQPILDQTLTSPARSTPNHTPWNSKTALSFEKPFTNSAIDGISEIYTHNHWFEIKSVPIIVQSTVCFCQVNQWYYIPNGTYVMVSDDTDEKDFSQGYSPNPKNNRRLHFTGPKPHQLKTLKL